MTNVIWLTISLNTNGLHTFISPERHDQKQLLEAFCRKKCSLKFRKIHRKTSVPEFRVSFLIKLQAAPATLLKKRLWHRCFPVNFLNFLRTPFLQNTSGRLLLHVAKSPYLVTTRKNKVMGTVANIHLKLHAFL